MIRRLHLIANPKGGVGDNEALAKRAEQILGDQGIETSLQLTQHAGHKHYGFNIIGWGLFSAANQLAESLRKLGRRRYDVAGLVSICQNRVYRGTLEMDGEETVEGGFSILTASNTIHTGEGTRLAPKARLDDGKLDLIYLRDASRVRLLRLFSKIRSGQHIDQPGVHYLQVSHFKLTTDEPLPINLDGELIESGTFEVRVLPGALDLLL